MSSLEFVQCNLCGERKRPSICEPETDFLCLRQTPYRIYRCARCGLVYMNPRSTWEVLEPIYNKEYLDKDHFNMQARNKYRLKRVFPQKIQLLRKLKPTGRVIDIGAGLGGFVYLAKRAGYNVEGYEVSQAEASMAKKTFNVDLNIGILTKEQYPPETFDIVHMHHVLEHIPNPREMFQLVFHLLKPGGYFYFEVPNDIQSSVFYYTKFAQKVLGRIPFSKPSIHHLYFYNYQTILKFVKELNFTLLFVKGKFHEVDFQNQIAKMIIWMITLTTKLAPSFEVLCQKPIKD